MEVAAGHAHALAVDEHGCVYAWGWSHGAWREEREERDTLTDSLQRGSAARVAADPHRSLHGPVRVALESGEGSGSEEEGNALQRREKELVKGVDVAAGFAHSLILAHSGQFSTRVVFSFCFMLRSWSSHSMP